VKSLDSLRNDAFDAVSVPELAPWIERGTYRFGVLVESEERAERLKRVISERDFPRLLIHVETVPSMDKLHEKLAR
jgi:hypothetical protein